jgi:hypothetical protein
LSTELSRGRGALASCGALAAGALTGIALRLVFSGKPGGPFDAMQSPFVLLVPVAVAGVTVFYCERERPRSARFHALMGAMGNVLFVLGTFFVLIEGLICTVLAVPLFMGIGALAGWAWGAIFRTLPRPGQTLCAAIVLPVLLGPFAGTNSPSQADCVVSELFVAAPPAAVWRQLLRTERILPDELGGALMYRIGVPLPLSAVAEQRGGSLVRHVTMGKSIHFDQISDDWQVNRRVLWHFRFAPDSFPPAALDEHVRIGGEHFDVIDAEYRIERQAGGSTLHVTMHYRVDTSFDWYARPLAKWIVGDFEREALGFYARRAQAYAAAQLPES